LSILFFSGCQSGRVLQVGDCKINTEESHTASERATGLMYRENLNQNSGMLFFLGRNLGPESAGGFHMRNVNFDLDLVFLSENKQVTDIQTVSKCVTADCPLYRPKALSYYVFELNSGRASECGLAEGDFLEF